MIESAAWRSLRTASRAALAKDVDLTVEGAANVPSSGPVVLAARHYHHLYDGCAILGTIPRPVHVVVGLDWIENAALLGAMQRACRAAGWPVVYRTTSGIDRSIWLPTLRRALEQSVDILRRGRVLLVFPEAYPTVDPHFTPKTDDDEILPFHAGFATIAIDAATAGIDVPIVPVGFHYRHDTKWRITMRFGAPIATDPSASARSLTTLVESNVRALSRP